MPDPKVSTVEKRPNLVVVHLEIERLDDTNLTAVRADASAAGAASPQVPVVLDMAKVRFVPSFSLSGLVQLNQEFKARGQRLVLTGLHSFVRNTMLITRLDRIFDIQDDLSTITGASGPAE
jgi:anti-anti-sigma factor